MCECVAEGGMLHKGGLGWEPHNNKNNNIANNKKIQEKKNNILGVPQFYTFTDPERHFASV